MNHIFNLKVKQSNNNWSTIKIKQNKLGKITIASKNFSLKRVAHLFQKNHLILIHLKKLNKLSL